jgi:hypothetical protein
VGHLFKKLRTNKSIFITFFIVGIACFLKAFFTWGGDWKTQTVLYRKIHNDNTSINVQLRADKFAFGYKKRVIQIHQIAPFMEWTTDIDTNQIDPGDWKKVNLFLNEMNLPNE